MIRLMLEPVNFLILDEPTNHLDMRSKEILKNALANFSGTVLVVSHDRDFLDGLVNCIYEFRNKKAKQHLGGIFDFLYRKKMESLKELESKKKNTKAAKVVTSEKEKDELSFDEKKEINRTISRMEKSVAQTEERIAELEAKIEDMDKLLAKPENIDDHSVFEQYEQLKTDLEQSMLDWENAHEELENWKAKKTW
jgi:ATP-binding cassette subfamily F protein 3